MGIDFRFRDFAYPFSILRLKKVFDRNQWLDAEALSEYQAARLRQIITHAYDNVPYYQKLFRENDIGPGDIQTAKDLKNIPCLTKDQLRLNFNSLVARDAKKYRPTMLFTSGTTGGKISFYADKTSNVLEFVYYWRFWGWAGYKLGDIFAALSSENFIYNEKNKELMYHFHPLTRQLTMNAMFFSARYLKELTGILRRYKPVFLKGSPMNLYMLALAFSAERDHGISFKAILSQGANLPQYKRDFIESIFSCRIFDSYGHMERTVAISQCPHGTYHVHADYGIAEFEEPRIALAGEREGDTVVREIVGTSLHNFSMPLIRYRTGDFARVRNSPENCACKRGFPTIVSVVGRETDIVITPEGRTIGGLSSVFSRTPGIVMGQIIQEKIDHLLARIVCVSEDPDDTDRTLTSYIRNFAGDKMKIEIEHTTIEGIKKDNFGKFKPVISNISEEYIRG
jgi:phenylacetate-CoA ligase